MKEKKCIQKGTRILLAVLAVLALFFAGCRIYGLLRPARQPAADEEVQYAELDIKPLDPTSVRTASDGMTRYAYGEIVLLTKDNVTHDQAMAFFMNEAVTMYGTVDVLGFDEELGLYQVRFQGMEALEDLRELAADVRSKTSLFEIAFPNYVFSYKADKTNDKEWNPWDRKGKEHWGADAIRLEEAWELIGDRPLSTVEVGILDNGLTFHDDLPQIATQYYNNDYYLSNGEGNHGTQVAGIIGAKRNNNLGIGGVTDRVKLHLFSREGLKAKTADPELKESSIFLYLNALSALVEKCHCKVINISQGLDWLTLDKARKVLGLGNDYTIEDHEQFVRTCMEIDTSEVDWVMRKLLRQHDFLIVTTAGNDRVVPGMIGKAEYSSLLAFSSDETVRSHVIVVGSADKADNGRYSMSDFSNYGERVDIVAPGRDIYSTAVVKDKLVSFLTGKDVYINGYMFDNGTSFAAPYVTGIAALIWSVNPDLSAAQVRRIILESGDEELHYSDSAGQSDHTEYRMVNAEKAIQTALSTEPEIVPTDTDAPDAGNGTADNPAQDRPSAPENSVELRTETIEYAGPSGYKYKVTLTFSPWILQSRTELINDVWKRLGQTQALPTPDNGWKLDKFKGNYYQYGSPPQFAANMTDMYYVLGTVSIENITEGWHFSADKPGDVEVFLPLQTAAGDTNYRGGITYSLCKVFFSNGSRVYATRGLDVPVSMTSDYWGPVGFVLGIADYLSPATPNGTAYDIMRDGALIYNGHEIKLDVYTDANK